MRSLLYGIFFNRNSQIEKIVEEKEEIADPRWEALKKIKK